MVWRGALFLGILPGSVRAEDFGAGFLDLSLTDPVRAGHAGHRLLPTKSDGATQVGPFTIAATRGRPGARSLSADRAFARHRGSHLAITTHSPRSPARFVAAAVEHPREQLSRRQRLRTDLQTFRRPHHIVALIDGVLGHATVGSLIDRARIGMAATRPGDTPRC